MKRRDANTTPLFPSFKAPKQAFRDLRNYLAGQFVGATRDDRLLDEVLKCLFCKLYIETGFAGEPPDGADLFKRAAWYRSVFAKVRKDYPDIYEEGAEILLDPEGVDAVMRECGFSLIDAASDPIGDAFEVFVGSESRGRSGQFFTPRLVTDLLVEAIAPKPGETVIDPACGAGGFLSSVARHYLATGLTPKKLSEVVSKSFYAIDKDDYLVQLTRLHVSLLTGGHPHVIGADSLSLQNGSGAIGAEFPRGGFDIVLTNPPFGTRIVAARPDVLQTFALARKWKMNSKTGKWAPTEEVQAHVPPQVLFVERCLSLLKEGGRLGMVLPESVLSNKSYRHVVEFLLAQADIRAVIGMPEALFKTSGKGGTHTKTCLLIAVKGGKKNRTKSSVFMAEAKWCGHDSRARAIPNNDLPQIAKNFSLFQAGRLRESSTLGFAIEKQGIGANVLCPRYYDPQVDRELKALGATHDLVPMRKLVDDGVLQVVTGHELGKLAYGTGDIPFIRTSDISNWELKADPKHGISRAIFESLRRKQDVRLHDLLMVKDGTYLIGTCAIVTEADTEMLYQSHLYKIRVLKNEKGLDPFLLLAILSSPVVQRQIRSKQFTQDIIDSLGERLYELVIPIPKDANARARVTEMVKTAVHRRVEARDLAKRARIAVAGGEG